MDRAIRILVANRPKLMRELILATLADEPGIEIVGEVADEVSFGELIDQRLAKSLDVHGRARGEGRRGNAPNEAGGGNAEGDN